MRIVISTWEEEFMRVFDTALKPLIVGIYESR